jgi:hypothetical protein
MRITGMHEFGMTIELTRNDVERMEKMAEVAASTDTDSDLHEWAEYYRTIFQLAFHAIRATDHRLIDGETLKPLRSGLHAAD